MSKLARFFDRIRTGGVQKSLVYAFHRYRVLLLERKYRIQSVGEIECKKLGLDESLFNGYCPVSFGCLRRVLKRVPIRDGQAGLIDYGAGMGRVVVVAATDYPFKRVIGVEIREELARIAEQNIDRARSRLRCTNTEIVVTDATTFVVPGDINIAFFFNPFRGKVLSDVMERLRESVTANPRTFWVLYVNPSDSTEALLKSTPGLVVVEEYTDSFIPGAEGKVIIFKVSAGDG